MSRASLRALVALVLLTGCGERDEPMSQPDARVGPPGDATVSDAGADASDAGTAPRCIPPDAPVSSPAGADCTGEPAWAPCGAERVCDGTGGCVALPTGVPLPPPDGASDRFGTALAADEQRLAVGDPRGEGTGAVYLYRRTTTGWRMEATITPPDTSPFEVRGFGDALALDGETLLVGAPESLAAGADSGAVFVYEDGDDGWDLVHRWTAPSGASDDWFGGSVAVHGTWAAASAIGFDADAATRSSGRVYLLERNAGGAWTPAGHVEAPMPIANGNFGLAIALDARRLAVGEPLLFGDRGGRAYVFELGASAPRAETLAPACLQSAPGFAMLGVAASEGRVAVSWVGFEGDRGIDPIGAVSLFERETGASSPSYYEALRAPHPDGTRGTQFGATVALSGTLLVVGAERAPVGGLTAAGEAFVLVRSADGRSWRQAGVLHAPDPVDRAAFGYALAVSGDAVVVAANPMGASGGVWTFEP